VNNYFWEKYGGSSGLIKEGVGYGTPSYIADIRDYSNSTAQVQSLAIYLMGWALSPEMMKAEAQRAVDNIIKQNVALYDFVPSGINLFDKNGRGDEFFFQAKGHDDCYTLRENYHGDPGNYLVARGVNQPFLSIEKWWASSDLTPVDYHWKFVQGTGETYKLVGGHINTTGVLNEATLWWAKNTGNLNQGKRSRYAIVDTSISLNLQLGWEEVEFKMIVQRGYPRDEVVVRLVDTKVWRTHDGDDTYPYFNNRSDPYLFQVKYQAFGRYQQSWAGAKTTYD
jgi:hypothetical protein